MAKLLVADDLVPIRQMVRITLSTQGWTIVEAKNGNEALELVRSEKPDLVLLDVDMGPGPNGFDVCRQIKADDATKDIPVVMLTAHESDSRSWSARWSRSGSRARSCGAPGCRASATCCSRRRSRTARQGRTSSASAGTWRRSPSAWACLAGSSRSSATQA